MQFYTLKILEQLKNQVFRQFSVHILMNHDQNSSSRTTCKLIFSENEINFA